MEAFLLEVAKQVPSLGVLCFIVWVFIRHLDKRDDTIKQMHKEHILAREELKDLIVDNIEAMESLRNAIEQRVGGK